MPSATAARYSVRCRQAGRAGKVRLLFDHAPLGLTTYGAELAGFELAGADRVFHPAKAVIDPAEVAVTVWSDAVAEPLAVRYGFEDRPTASLYNTQGLPASSFRSDDW